MSERFLRLWLFGFTGSFVVLAIWRGINHNWAWMVADILIALGFGALGIRRIVKDEEVKP